MKIHYNLSPSILFLFCSNTETSLATKEVMVVINLRRQESIVIGDTMMMDSAEWRSGSQTAPVGCIDCGGALHIGLRDTCLDGRVAIACRWTSRTLSSLHGTDTCTGSFKSDRSLKSGRWSCLPTLSSSHPPSFPMHGWMFIMQGPPKQKQTIHLCTYASAVHDASSCHQHVSMSVILWWK